MAETKEQPKKVEDCTNPDVVTKYKEAGGICDAALAAVKALAVPGAKVFDLCSAGDAFMEERCSKVFNKGKVRKGVSFPTCVCVNHIVGHYSPLSKDTMTIKAGDFVKIDLGCHIDGYAGVAATTMLVGDAPAITGKAADVLMATHLASELVLRLLRPGVAMESIADKIAKIADEFGVSPVMGVCSHNIERNNIDGDKIILAKPDPEQKTANVNCGVNEVFVVDIVMTSGEGTCRPMEGRAKEITEQSTVFMRNPANQYQLKMKASRGFLGQIGERFPHFPFTLRAFGAEDRAKVQMGIREMTQHGIVTSYPILCDKKDSIIGHLKFTVLIMPNGNLKVTGSNPLDLPNINSEKKVGDEEINKILSSSVAKKKKKRKKKVAESKK